MAAPMQMAIPRHRIRMRRKAEIDSHRNNTSVKIQKSHDSGPAAREMRHAAAISKTAMSAPIAMQDEGAKSRRADLGRTRSTKAERPVIASPDRDHPQTKAAPEKSSSRSGGIIVMQKKHHQQNPCSEPDSDKKVAHGFFVKMAAVKRHFCITTRITFVKFGMSDIEGFPLDSKMAEFSSSDTW